MNSAWSTKSWDWWTWEATEGELEGELLLFLISCKSVFIPVSLPYNLFCRNVSCWQRNFKNQIVLGNVIRLKSIWIFVTFLRYLWSVAQKYAVAAITFRRWMLTIYRRVVAAWTESVSLLIFFSFSALHSKKCKTWTQRVPNLFILCLALVLNLFVVQKLLLFLVWHTWENMLLGLLHLLGPSLWQHYQIKLNYRNLPFSNLFIGRCPRNDVSTKHFKQYILHGKKCGMWKGGSEISFLLCVICVTIFQHSELL